MLNILIYTIISILLGVVIAKYMIKQTKKNCGFFKSPVPKVPSPTTPYTAKPFSPSEYLERFEKLNLEILEEREKQRNEYESILWVGLKGLKLNKDGTTEWIKRESSKPVKKKVDNQNTKSDISRSIESSWKNMCTQRQIQAINNQIRALQRQQAQQIQNANIPCPSYTSTFNPDMCNYTWSANTINIGSNCGAVNIQH